MIFVGATRTDNPAMTRGDHYRPSLFIIGEGKCSFHERLHYWQHVGSTLGAFQILGFHITSKTMRIAIRNLIATDLMEVPIRQNTLKRLHDRTRKVEVQQLLSYLSLLNRFESASFVKPIRFKGLSAAARFHGGRHARQPLFKISETLGIPFTAMQVKEIHAFAIAKLRCEPESLGAAESVLWKRAEKYLGEETAEWMALLCDWALMPPNPNLIDKRPGEIHPGSRFLKGLEVLTGTDTETRKALFGPNALSSWLSNVLDWETIETSLKHYESFIALAREGSKNDKDADRNRKTYSAIAGMLETARDIRFKYPEALAFPHLYESMLMKSLPAIAIKRGRKLEIMPTGNPYKGESPEWYVRYLGNVALTLQAFGYKEQNQDRIECVYRYLGIEEDCSALKKAGKDEVCFTYPCFNDGLKIECGFLNLCGKLGLN